MRRAALILGVGLLSLTLATCGSEPAVGELTLNLTTPRSDDGAIQFTATAVTPDSIVSVAAACSGCQLFTVRVSATEVRGVVTGDVTAGAVLRLTVTNVGKPEAFAASVVAAASKTFKVQTGAYSLGVQK